MSLIKTSKEIETLREGGRILARVLELTAARAAAGVSTLDLENFAAAEIEKAGAAAAFKGYRPNPHVSEYPAVLCTSINEEIVHCVPGEKRRLKDGDILSVDLGIKFKGLFTDAAVTVAVGRVDSDGKKLIEETKKALYEGIARAREGNRIGDIAEAIERVGRAAGLGVIRDLVGHGVGHAIHEPPNIPNYGKRGTLGELKVGMVIAIEPMFTLGGEEIEFLDDKWTVVTRDGSRAAHFEHTVAITDAGADVLTARA